MGLKLLVYFFECFQQSALATAMAPTLLIQTENLSVVSLSSPRVARSAVQISNVLIDLTVRLRPGDCASYDRPDASRPRSRSGPAAAAHPVPGDSRAAEL